VVGWLLEGVRVVRDSSHSITLCLTKDQLSACKVTRQVRMSTDMLFIDGYLSSIALQPDCHLTRVHRGCDACTVKPVEVLLSGSQALSCAPQLLAAPAGWSRSSWSLSALAIPRRVAIIAISRHRTLSLISSGV
jgi:hypothetical protein